jgi:sugar/nucleoside kinase (ribokinase family)
MLADALKTEHKRGTFEYDGDCQGCANGPSQPRWRRCRRPAKNPVHARRLQGKYKEQTNQLRAVTYEGKNRHYSHITVYNQTMSLVVVGSVAYDGVETPHGRVDRMLGGAATYISLASSFFTKTRLVAVVGDDFADEDTRLLAGRGIDLEGLERVPGKTFFWAGKYSEDMNDRVTLTTELNVFADFNPKIPESYRKSPYLLLGNIQPALQRSVRQQMNGLRLAGGDTMNFWIKDFREELLATIRDWDFLLINDSEARMLSGCENLRRSAQKILDMGPHTLVIKRGEYGAMLFRRDSYFIVPGYLLEDVFDPTGAGDCFAGGFIGYLAEQGFDLEADHISRGDLSRAVIYGSVMGSFCCEKFGVERFRTLTRADIDGRFEEFRKFTSF